MTVAERFWAKVDKCGDCWIWSAGRLRNGYGQFRLPDKHVLAHRFAYELEVGLIPEGLTIDHLCRVRECVNPAHLEAVSLRENLLRAETFQGVNARKNECPKGHPYSEENTRMYRGKRHCRSCDRARDARRRGK